MREYLWNISGKSPKKKKDLKLKKKKEKEFERFCLCGICSLCNQQEYYRRMQKVIEEKKKNFKMVYLMVLETIIIV